MELVTPNDTVLVSSGGKSVCRVKVVSEEGLGGGYFELDYPDYLEVDIGHTVEEDGQYNVVHDNEEADFSVEISKIEEVKQEDCITVRFTLGDEEKEEKINFET